LPTWDAVQYALALQEYDVVKHQPHPPGYILYVALARLVALVTPDATTALGALALGATVVTVVLVYWLAWRLYGRAAAVVATVGLATSPLFWFYGEVALPYTTEAALAMTVAVLTWPMWEGRTVFAHGSALALGIAGGVRQALLILLLPLWIVSARVALGGWPPVLRGLAVVGLVAAAWAVPMVWLAGGLGAFVGASVELFQSTVRATTVVGHPGAWRANAAGLGEGLVLAFGVLLPIAGLGLIGALRGLPRWDGRAWFFAAWILPPLAVYTLVHFGQYGYLLTIVPAVYILLARALVGPVPVPVGRRGLAAVVVGVAALVHAVAFARAPAIEVPGLFASAPGTESWTTNLQARYRFRLWPTTVGGLREQEAVIAAYVDGVRQRFDPADTVLVTELGNPRSYAWFRHVCYYLPEFPVYHLRLGHFSPGYLASRVGVMAALDGPEILLPPSTRRLVWVVDYWNPGLPRPRGLREEPLPHGRWLYTLEVERRVVEHGGYRITPARAVARLR
jgi:4-amino-4-deoxy-L-arabinose transferase-like glycosyltransferase